jgi:hypothetical protein
MNIYEYFTEKMGHNPADDSLKELPVESPCGADCKAAIDAGAALLHHVHNAFVFGDVELGQQRVISTVNCIIECYWRG